MKTNWLGSLVVPWKKEHPLNHFRFYCAVLILSIGTIYLENAIAQRNLPLQPSPLFSGGKPEAVTLLQQTQENSSPLSSEIYQFSFKDEKPTETTLGFPIYPATQYLTSYEAGYGQRYFLFGTNADFQEIVRYYSLVLDERGRKVFDFPPTHIFEIGRFREESMAFPPSVTIKDYTWNDSKGYLNPTLGAQPERFRTIIQIVPTPTDQSDQ